MHGQAKFVPKYIELADWLRDRIHAGVYGAGEKLESENQLIAQFGYSRQTVRHAIDMLCEEGLIHSVRGSGSFVNDISVQKPKSYTIGVILTNLTDYFAPSIISGIEETLSSNQYAISLNVTKERIDAERRILESLIEANNLDGLLIEATKTAHPTPNGDLFKKIADMHIPFVFVNSVHHDVPAPYIETDDFRAGLDATRHLIDLKHRRIAGLFSSEDYQGKRRYMGYCQALLEAGIPLNDDYVLWQRKSDINEFSVDPSFAPKVENLMRECTAIVCYNDRLTVALLKIAEEMNLQVPEDLSIISFDNSMLAQYGKMRFTSMNHPKDLLGREGASMLLQMIQNKARPESRYIHMDLVPGTTTAICREYSET